MTIAKQSRQLLYTFSKRSIKKKVAESEPHRETANPSSALKLHNSKGTSVIATIKKFQVKVFAVLILTDKMIIFIYIYI